MSDIAIRVEHLGKQYRLGGQQASYATFRDAIVNTASAPLRWLKGEKRAEKEDFWALDDVSFEVKHGEVVGIIGRNGAGKSTLLKILSRITSPTRGRVDIYGRVGSLLEVGTGFHPELTGRENIFLNGAILGMHRVEIARKFDEIVDFSGIEKFLDTPVKHYSSGMYVRLAFAVAAHLEPEILLVDEVLAVGDAEFQKKCLGKMGEVAYDGRTVLFVSHNLGAIIQLCKRVIMLEKGKVENNGDAGEVIKKYMNNSNGKNEALFEPDQTKDIQILSMKVTDDECLPRSSLLHTDSITIIINYQIRKWPVGSYFCLDVFNQFDQRLIWTCDVNSKEEMLVERPPGIYQAKITIPDTILAPGRYSFTAAVYAPGHSYPSEVKENVISIEIIDGGTLLSNFGISYHAATTIPLPWKISKIE